MNATLTLGTMNFGARTPIAEARRIVDRALERGITHFDTANLYGEGESEKILGELVRDRRDQVQIATKVGLLRRGGKTEGLSAARLPEALKESLTRLGTDYVDLYYLHAPDPSVPIEETLDALQSLLESKQIRAWGVSNFASWQILELEQAALKRGMPAPSVSQVLYNLLIRQLDLEYFAFTKKHPLHTTVYNPLAGGLLARRPKVGTSAPQGSRFDKNPFYRRRYWTDALVELTEKYAELADSLQTELVTLAYAWLAQRPGVNSILTGPGSLAHLDAALEASTVKLERSVVEQIDAIHRAFVGTDASYAR